MSDIKIPASSRDRKIGWVLLAIGVLWILLIIFIEYGNYKSPMNTRTFGQLIGGIVLNSLIPLVLVTSGNYYLSGGNAKRIAKKKGSAGQGLPAQPLSPASSTETDPNINPQTPTTVIPNNPQPVQPVQPDSVSQNPTDVVQQ